MKQNDLLSNLLNTKTSLNERIRRQNRPSQKPVYSPRLITRKKEKKEQPVNPFARRKVSQQTNSVLRYMSFKRGHNEENFTFLSDDNQINFSQFQSQQSMFNLHFSRIKSSYLSGEGVQQRTQSPKNLFDDLMDSSKELSIDGSVGSLCRESRKSQRLQEFDNVEGGRMDQSQNKSGLSLQTMSESPNLKDGGRLEDRLGLLVRENKKLMKSNRQLSAQNEKIIQENNTLKNKVRQLQTEIQKITNQMTISQQNFHQQLQKNQQNFNQRVTELQLLLQQVTKQLTQLKKSQISNKHHIKQLQDTQQILQKQCLQKQHYLKSLHDEIEELRHQIEQKQQYSKCLQDVILELNGKIDQLRNQNEDLNVLIEEKTQRVDVLEMEREALVRNLKSYQRELVQCREKIDALMLCCNQHKIYAQQQKSKKQIQSSKSHQQSQSIHLIQQLQKEITTLHSVIDIEKQHNEKLKKQISYKLIQIDFLKKNHYQHQKNTLEIATLKERNKRLTKKLNRVIEDFEIFKEKTAFGQKKITKNAHVKKVHSTTYIENQQASTTKTKLQTQNKQKASTRTNIHQAQVIQSNQNNNNQNKNKKFNFESDDQLSFKLSPQKI